MERKITAEELIRFTKPITMATAKAVAAGNSCRQEDVIVVANTGRKAISDLLKACKVQSTFTPVWCHSDNVSLNNVTYRAYRNILQFCAI